ncbi:hypothetical protein [Brevibacterium marinum]|uniref:Uncharacterized protein n=1 Tax=Brevibacterium marinum TaxID=418643 RepID=A0A846S9B7_9MICO|nr:hypothetical protein [Brevibacterium marinum]NJC57397.1 hypothetical protein [Brevibacterium marinum]
MDDEKNEDWRNQVPESERLGDSSRVSDRDWEDLVNQIAEPSAMMGDMPVDEVRERLEEEERWEPGPAEPIGWRTASPTLVLSVIATFGAVLLLLIGTVFFRPLPGWFLLVGIAVGLGGAVGLFFHLPSSRSGDGDNGASV